VAQAIYAITATLSLVSSVVTWADPLFNPLNVNASILTYLIDLGVIMPLAFVALRKLLGLARGGRRA
jgi:hypothetical protein